MKDTPFWAEGVRFECTSCGHCCRHEPGYVFLSQNDLTRLAQGMGMKEKDFISKHCRRVDLGVAVRLSLLEKSNNDCIFWDEGCTVYEHRPLQCRTYPFWPAIMDSQEAWDEESKECPGMNHGALRSKKEIHDALSAREGDVLLSPDR
ncbi:MAG: YkgJ family cysteine cluster protein [Spirochaetales bacterium]|nr:YkgJ family cysteine cluster protein [Spirochaetales bacterium]